MIEDIIFEMFLLIVCIVFAYMLPIQFMADLKDANYYLLKIDGKADFYEAVKHCRKSTKVAIFGYILLSIFTFFIPMFLIWLIPYTFEMNHSYVYLVLVILGILICAHSPELREPIRQWAKYSYRNIELQKKYIRYYRASFYMMMIILICFGLHLLHFNIFSRVIWGLAIIINYVCIFIYEKASIDKSFVATRCKLIGYYIDGKAEAWEKEDVCGLELTEVEGQKDLIIKMKDGGEVTLWNISDAWYEEIEKTLKVPDRCGKSESESI